MPQLTLNNWAVPVSEAKAGVVAIGSISRAYSGVLRRVQVANKREWAFTTAPMPQTDASTLEGLLLARGEYYPGDGDAFSSKGTPPVQDNGVMATPGKFSTGFWPRAGTVNLFAANVRTGGDASVNTTGFFPLLMTAGYNGPQSDGTMALSSSQKYQGTYSIYVDLSDATQGLFGGCAATVAVSPSTQYTFSCYTRGDNQGSGVTLGTVVFGNNDNVTINSRTNGINSTTAWERWTCTFTTGATCNSVRCVIGENLNGGYNFWTDAWQLEIGALASPWADGVSSPINLAYNVAPYTELGADGITIAGFARIPSTGGVFAALQPAAGGNPSIRLAYSNTNTLTATVTDAAGVTAQCAPAWTTPNTFAHLALVVLQAPATGPAMFVYIDGILAASATASVPDLKTLTTLYVGNRAGANPWGSSGVIDEVNFFPFAASAGLLKALATTTVQQARYPMLLAAGDCVGDPARVLGSDVQTHIMGGAYKGAWHNNLAVVEFALSEV
jgi:hypothetical protein